MEVKTAIETRRTIRSYKPDPIPDDYISEVLDAARLAPSGGNIQPWKFVIIKSSEARQKLGEYTLPFVARAPVVFVACTDLSVDAERKERYQELKETGALQELKSSKQTPTFKVPEMNRAQLLSSLNINTAIAVEHLILRATELGLGSSWIMMFKRKELATWLNLEQNLYPLCLVPIGFPAQSPPPRPRKTLAEIIIKEV